jgi:uncharacterized protein YkwD
MGAVALAALLHACGEPFSEDDLPEPIAPEAAVSAEPLTSSELSQLRAQMLTAVNNARAKARTCGATTYPAVPALTRDSRLELAAQRHSADMASKNFFSHTGSDGSSPFDRMLDAGYNFRAAGENIAAGYPDVARTLDQWLKSEGHCKNIMNAKFVHLGVGFADNSASTYKYYWTQTLGAPL